MEKGIAKNLALDFVRVTESAAIAASKWVGKGDAKAADQAAVDEMRDRFNQIDFTATVIIGEGDKDEAPKLYIGEKIGNGSGPEMDLAVDPLECTDSVAYGRDNAQAVIALGPKGTLLHAPDTYMNKIATGPAAAGVIDIDASVKDNLTKISKALGKDVAEVSVVVMDRDRNKELIEEISKVGSRITLISDGDMSAAISACIPNSGVDVLMGIGASAESVLAAVAVKVYGGEFICRFTPHIRNDEQEILSFLEKFGIKDINTIFRAEDLAKGDDLSFTATGILDGPMLKGVRFEDSKIITHSVVIRGKTKTVRYITTEHIK